MLAKGKGFISIEEFRGMFNLPEDAEITSVNVRNGIIEFEMLSAEEVDGKFVKTEFDYEDIRRFRLINKYKAEKITNMFKVDAEDTSRLVIWRECDADIKKGGK